MHMVIATPLHTQVAPRCSMSAPAGRNHVCSISWKSSRTDLGTATAQAQQAEMCDNLPGCMQSRLLSVGVCASCSSVKLEMTDLPCSEQFVHSHSCSSSPAFTDVFLLLRCSALWLQYHPLHKSSFHWSGSGLNLHPLSFSFVHFLGPRKSMQGQRGL